MKKFLKFILTVAIILGLAWFLRAFVIQPYQIPSASMETTIMTNDIVIAEKVSYYFREPAAGDIVTFEDPEVPNRTLIKRVIATGGQTVNLIDGRVYVDGVAIDEPYTNGQKSYPYEKSEGITYPYTVPEGYVWVMGDNRTNSKDSRYFGAIKVSSINGRGCFIYWPLDQVGVLN
ncbi:MAG: signal peptidase I [Eggerthellaceae bacterium]|jgi:signal peptidase I